MSKYLFVIIGVGGTGSLLARDLPKLLIGTKHEIMLVDGDRVEEKNMKRQSYQKHDISENKAIALSSKINSFYETNCYAVDKFLTKDELKVAINNVKFFDSDLGVTGSYIPVLVGCVDNDKTRQIIENTFGVYDDVVYLDSANSEFEGNVFVTSKIGGIQKGKLRSEIYEFEEDIHPLDQSCQVLAAGNTQFLITNVKMATMMLEHINALMSGELKEGVSRVGRFETVHIASD